jgi:RNA polymerase sigma-70 factor (ECF subfamily)
MARWFFHNASPHSTALIEAHIPGLRRFARALLRGDRDRADDLVQDTLERALSRWRHRHRDCELREWIYTILYNRFLNDQRRQRRHAANKRRDSILSERSPAHRRLPRRGAYLH